MLICVATIEAASAFACGSDFVMMMMFRAYPEAKLVYDAEQRAQKAGLFVGEKLSPPSDRFSINHRPKDPEQAAKALHEWRVEKIAVMIDRFNKRLQSVPAVRQQDEKAYIFLIHELQWVELQAAESGFQLVLKDTPPPNNATRVFTTNRILNNFLDGTVSWQIATNEKLIVARGAAESVNQWFSVLRNSFEKKREAVVVIETSETELGISPESSLKTR